MVGGRSEAWTVFARSNTKIAGSNLIQCMDVFVSVYSVFLLPRVWLAVLRRADPSSEESYHVCKKDYETEEEAGPNKGL
jgi:hypothetical protein